MRLFYLKRCAHEIALAAPGGRRWTVLHIHLSVFDRGGELRRAEMAALRGLMLARAARGDLVVVAGDWNQAFLPADHFAHRARVPRWFQRFPDDWLPPGWRLVFDRRVPSLRSTETPYRPGETFVTSVDGAVVSPGVRVTAARCLDLGFGPSDHHPLVVELEAERDAS